jgi:hypothetical protein
MKTSRIIPPIVATLALTVAGHAYADGGTTVRLDTVQKMWVLADDIGPKGKDNLPRVSKDTGAGVMDANFTFDRTAAAQANYGTEVLIGATYTRSANTPNDDNSYMQGGFALGKITEKGVELGTPIDLPELNGERAYMRPLIAFTQKYVLLVAASEDNNSNNGNPKPVAFLADKATGKLVQIKNNTRRDINKPTDLIEQARRDGIDVDNPDNQRGPHMIVPVTDNSFLIGNQYNNQRAEVFRVTVDESGAAPEIHVNWLNDQLSNNAVHDRPQVAYTPGATELYMTAVECNAQPANIGIRVNKLDVATGQKLGSKIVVKADPRNNKYVAEPSIADMGDSVAIGFAFSAKARERNGNNGHAGGANVSQLVLVNKADLTTKGDILAAPANYQRHAHIFGTTYGPNGDKAIAVISGSSTGTAKGLVQLFPLTADGSIGAKDPLKMYTVSTFSDVANLQARGKRNPNNQAKGFINGLGGVPNPGFDKPGAFYPEVKSFSMSTVTGYSSDAAKDIGRRESLWLSLVPSSWKEGLQTTPGVPSETAGEGPAPRTTAPATDPSAEVSATSDDGVDGTEATRPGDAKGGSGLRNSAGADAGGCAVGRTGASGSTGMGLVALAIAGVLAGLRRTKKEG